jgi:hypothetical protein
VNHAIYNNLLEMARSPLPIIRQIGLHGSRRQAILEAVELYRSLANASPESFNQDLAVPG